MENFLNSLRQRRADIEASIEREQARPAPDSLTLHHLKKLKLHFREKIEYLERLSRDGKLRTIEVVRRRSDQTAPVRLRG